jgi:RluA family pseudouridine synthase
MEWTVEPHDTGKKLSIFLFRHLKGEYSSKFIKHAIEKNCCKINGRIERFASTFVGAGDTIVLDLENIPEKRMYGEEKDRILYEDPSLFIYNKPPGINCDREGILKLLQKRDPSLHLIHRLDRETTGVLLLAKNEEIFKALVDQFKERKVQKHYLAIVDGMMKKNHGVIRSNLGKLTDFAGQSLWGSVDIGLEAITEWNCMRKGNGSSLLSCFPKTGRTHQLRVHLSEMGHPILGDFQYGKKFGCSYRPPRMLLHSYEIDFFHPRSGDLIHVMAPVPEDFKKAQEELFKG